MSTRDSRPQTRAPRAKSGPKDGPRDQGRDQGRKGAGARHFSRAPEDRHGGVWLYGIHAVSAALLNPRRRIRRLLATAEAAKAIADPLDEARATKPIGEEIVEKADLDRVLPPGAVHQGIAAQVEPLPAVTMEDVAEIAAQRERAVVVVLDQVTDPHNVGAIMRSAAAFGVLAVVVPDRNSPDETGTLAKSASGALERMPLVRVTNVVRAIEDLKGAGFWIAGLAGESPFTLASQNLTGRIALVLGAEGEGLRRLTREHCDYIVKLPMTGEMESLNVSNAAAVALYELVRE